MNKIQQPTEKRIYRVLFFGNFQHFSVGEPEIANAFESLGHSVKRVQINSVSLRAIKQTDFSMYDFILFSKFRVGRPEEVIEFLKTVSIPSVCWMFDLYWGYRREQRITDKSDPMFSATIVFTTDGGSQEKWDAAGVNHVCLRQGIAADVVKGEPIYPTKARMGFVGSLYTWDGWTYRADLVHWMKENYKGDFEHFGANGMLRHKDLDNLLATLKITIGDSVYSPYYWSNRIYEMIGRGAFLIHPKIEGLDKEFIPYKHYIPYNYGDMKGLKEKIDYYLTHNAEREAIRQAGFEYCHANHTYTHRVKDLLRILEEKKILC